MSIAALLIALASPSPVAAAPPGCCYGCTYPVGFYCCGPCLRWAVDTAVAQQEEQDARLLPGGPGPLDMAMAY